MDTLTAVRYFVETVRHGGFSPAARALNVSTSVLTRHVVHLEHSLGVELLTRTTRQVTLTEPGRAYHDHAILLLEAADASVRAAREYQASPVGQLRVTAPSSFGRRYLATGLEQFNRDYPDICIDLHFADRHADIVAEAFDVAIRIGEIRDSSHLVLKDLAPLKRVLCAAPSYLERQGVPASPAELASHRCLRLRFIEAAEDWTPRLDLWRFRQATDDIEVAVSGPVMSNDADVLLAAAIDGLGITILPEWLVRSAIAAEALCPILTNWTASPSKVDRRIHILYPTNRRSSPKVHAFVEFVAEHLRRELDL